MSPPPPRIEILSTPISLTSLTNRKKKSI